MKNIYTLAIALILTACGAADVSPIVSPVPTVSAPADNEPNVTFNDWVRSFGRPLPTQVNNNIGAPSRSEFLAGGETSLDETGVDRFHSRGKGTLTLATAGFNNFNRIRDISGDAADGVSFFRDFSTRKSPSSGNFFVGLLSGTDLGLPLEETTGKAEWNGTFHLLTSDDDNLVADMVLVIDFENNSIDALTSQSAMEGYHLNGTYDSDGVITGTINFIDKDGFATRTPSVRQTEPGILTGLIGQEGAVGAFISHGKIGVANYGGGFTALPPKQ